MTRTAIRHTLSALAAAALLSTFASGAVAGETRHFLGLDHTLTNKQSGMNVRTPKGLATKKQKAPKAPGWVPSDADIAYAKQGLG